MPGIWTVQPAQVVGSTASAANPMTALSMARSATAYRCKQTSACSASLTRPAAVWSGPCTPTTTGNRSPAPQTGRCTRRAEPPQRVSRARSGPTVYGREAPNTWLTRWRACQDVAASRCPSRTRPPVSVRSGASASSSPPSHAASVRSLGRSSKSGCHSKNHASPASSRC